MWSAGTNGPKVATVAKMKEPMGVVPGASRKEDFPQQSDVSAEQLGSQTIDNVVATGERTTTATPAGRIGERRADYGYARGVDIERDEVGAAAEVDGPADGRSDHAPCRLFAREAEIRRCLVPPGYGRSMSFAAEFRRNGRLYLSRSFGDSMGASATALDNQTSLRQSMLFASRRNTTCVAEY
jgi:hypothetical protein